MIRTNLILAFLTAYWMAGATTYTLVATGDWNDPAVWSPSGIPAAGDDVYFLDNGNSLRLTLTEDATVRTLIYEGDYRRDTLTGAGVLTITENAVWLGGWLAGALELVIPAGKTFGLLADTDTSNRKCLKDQAKITNHGTMTWENLGIFFYGTPVIHNIGTFIDNTAYNRLYRADDDPVHFFELGFINDGTFLSNSQELSLHIGFLNNGTLQIQSGWVHGEMWLQNNGILGLNAAGPLPHQLTNYDGKNGTLHFGTPATLQLINSTTANGGSSVGTVTGSTGTLFFGYNSSEAVTAIHGPVAPGIRLDFGAAGRVAVWTDLTILENSNFEKSATGDGRIFLTTGKTLNWRSGYLGGTVEMIVPAGATLQLSGPDGKGLQDSTRLTNHGTVTYQGGWFSLQAPSTRIDNHGAFRLLDNSPLENQSNGSVPLFSNNGLLEKTGGGGTSQLQVRCENHATGTLAARSGIMGFSQPLVNEGRLGGNAVFLFPNGQVLGGTIAPDGWLTFLHDVTLTDTLEIDITAGVPDRLSVNGTTTLATETVLRLSPDQQPVPAGMALTLLQANARTGTFGQVEAPCIGWILDYTAQQARLTNEAPSTGNVADIWTGAGDGLLWSAAANWSTGRPPLPCHDAVIPAGASVLMHTGMQANIHLLQVDIGGEFILEAGAELEVTAY